MYGSKHRTTDGLYSTRKDGSGYSSSKREWNSQAHGYNDESSSQKKYIRTQSSSSNRSVPSSSLSQQHHQNGERDKKPVRDTKKPLRVSGDWSEFKSSTGIDNGKTYFYNCKTEVSQWEKPKGWPNDETTSSSSRATSTSSSSDRAKKESSSSHSSSTLHARHKVDGPIKHSRLQLKPNPISNSTNKDEPNGDTYSHTTNNLNKETIQSNESFIATSNIHQPSPNDDNSRMSFSSASSKESTSVKISDRNGKENGNTSHSSLSEPALSVSTPVSDKPNKVDSTLSNGNDSRSSTNRQTIPSATTEPMQVLYRIFESEIDQDRYLSSMEIELAATKVDRDLEIQKYYRANLIQHLTDWPASQFEKQCFKLFDDYYNYSTKMSTGFVELKALKSNFRVLDIKQNILRQRLVRCQQLLKQREDDKSI